MAFVFEYIACFYCMHATLCPQVNMLAPDKAGAAELVVLPATDQPQPHCTGLRVTDTHLWFWRSVYQLMRLDVTKTGAEARAELVATLQLPSNREQKIPSWQLDPATWMVYYKVGGTVTGAMTVTDVSQSRYCTQLHEHPTGPGPFFPPLFSTPTRPAS